MVVCHSLGSKARNWSFAGIRLQITLPKSGYSSAFVQHKPLKWAMMQQRNENMFLFLGEFLVPGSERLVSAAQRSRGLVL